MNALQAITDTLADGASKFTRWANHMTQDDLEGYFHEEQGEKIAAAFYAATNLSHAVAVSKCWPKVEAGTRIALMHSELSEMLEGVRKGKKDDHIPSRSAVEVEAADLLHRLFDFAGEYDLDLGGAYIEKGLYNLKRADHKPENRVKAGGKKF